MTPTDLLKTALTTLGTAVVSMLGFWFVHLQHLPDRAEVRVMITNENPYVGDRQLLLHRLDNLTETTKELDQSVRKLREDLARLPEGKSPHTANTE